MQKRFFVRMGVLRFSLTAVLRKVARTGEPGGFSCCVRAATALVAACYMGFSIPAEAGPQILKGHVPPITKRLAPKGRLESDRQLDLAIGLPLRNRENLTNLLQDLYRPSSPNFRHFLSADQFASTFGPSQEDYQAVIDFAKSHGLTVKKTHSNRTLVDVSGAVADIENAFHVKMRVYQHPTEKRTFFAPDVEPSLDLQTPVLAVSGLDNYVSPRPQIHWHGPAQPAVSPLGGGGGNGGGGGTGGGGGGPGSPTDLAIGYDFQNAYLPDVTLDGTGQSVGLFELAGYSDADITSYESEAGLPNVNLINIYIDGAVPGDDVLESFNIVNDLNLVDYYVEVTGDIEMAMAMAPGLDSILVYQGPTPLDESPLATNFVQYSSTTAQINDVLNRMATDDLASQLSCSYQMDINLSTVQIYQQFAAQGQSFFQASGDFGAFPGAIDEPSDDPYITIVGGTTVNTSAVDGSWISEVVWLTPASDDGLGSLLGTSSTTPLEASGGGVSLTYPIPVWQQGISMTANQGSTTMRNLPDVALVANNVDVVWGSDFLDGILEDYEGSLDNAASGTSLSTPLWAGFMALVNQQAAANGQPPIGFANPALYAIGKSTNYNSAFHDITSGNSFNPNSPTKYSATVGYDLCSGWGTINTNLINALLAPPSESLVITPPLGFTSFGPGGGPFTVTSQTYTLTNIGSSPLNWSLVNSAPWLSVSSSSGTLNPRGPVATITVSLNAAATNFLIGNYSGNVMIYNLTDSTMQNRQFDFYPGNGGFETGDFSCWTLNADTNLVFALAADDVDIAGTNALIGVPDALFVHSGLYGAYLGEYPTDGSLSQPVATTAGQQYLVSFWLTSLAYEGLTTPNNFAASWNGSMLYNQTNLPAFGWTNLQYVVPGTGKSSTLQFSFQNTPAGFGLDDISVEVAAPVLQSVALTSSNIMFTWSSIPNLSYQIQSATNLNDPNWTNVAAAIPASSNLVSAFEPIGKASQQFYRVILLSAP